MTTSNTTTLAKVQLQQVIEQLEQILFCDLVMTYNDFAEVNHYERIFDNDEESLNNIFLTPYDAIMQTNHKDYNENDDYFVFNGYGHAVSFSYQLVQDDNCPIDIEELAQWIVDSDSYSDYDIEVTTLEDMLASIEDNINDADLLVLALMMDRLSLDLSDGDTVVMNGYKDLEEYYIETLIDEVSDYDYNQLNDIILMLGINYN